METSSDGSGIESPVESTSSRRRVAVRRRILPLLALTPSLVLFGAMVGGLLASRVLEQPADGWTQISQVLGGLMLGGLGGLVIAGVFVFWGSPRLLWRLAGGATLGALVLVAVAWVTGPERGGGSGTPEAGTPEAGTPEAGTPEAGTPEAGTPEAGTPVAGTPEAGTPDAGTPVAGTPIPESAAEPVTTEPAPSPSGEESEAPVGDGPAPAPGPAPEADVGRLPCEPTATRASVSLVGELHRGESFRRAFGPGWELTLEPLASGGQAPGGWTIRVLAPPGRGDAGPRDLARLTPPLQGPSPLRLQAWHFLDTEGTGPNQGEVNAPQRLRLFVFSPEVGRTIGVGGRPTPEEVERVSAFGRGALEIGDLEISPPTNPGRPETAAIEQLRFAACLTWPRDVAPEPGAVPLAQASTLRSCGLDDRYRIAHRLDPPVHEADLDGDGVADLAAVVRRRGDGAPALALCRRGPGQLTLIGPEGSLGELVPAYFESVDRWSIERRERAVQGATGEEPPSLPGAGLVLGKEDSSSVLVYWNGERWASYWQGD